MILLAACSCGNVTVSPDAAKPDTGPVVDAGKCGANAFFTGEHVDWDESDAAFCGVFNSTWKVRGSSDATMSDTTSPNGRFELCIPAQTADVILDVTPDTAASQCPNVAGNYPLRGIAIANAKVQAELPAGRFFSARSYTLARGNSFYTQIGASYDPAKGALFIHTVGAPKPIAITTPHDTAEAYDGTLWAAGATGVNVYFPNVAAGTTTIQAATNTVGPTTVPIEANTITYVTLIMP